MDGFSRFTEKAQETLARAQQMMSDLGHTQLDVEHVLLALLQQPDALAVRILQKLRVNPDFVKSRVTQTMQRKPKLSVTGGPIATGQIYLTPQSKRLFDDAGEEATRMHDQYVGNEHLFLAVIGSGTSDAARIMHVALPIGEGQVLMGSDRPSSMGPTTSGDKVHLRVSPYSTEGARRIFDMLSEGGQITMPFEKAVGGAGFGMCTDRFGVNWMVKYDPNEGTSASKRWWRG